MKEWPTLSMFNVEKVNPFRIPELQTDFQKVQEGKSTIE